MESQASNGKSFPLPGFPEQRMEGSQRITVGPRDDDHALPFGEVYVVSGLMGECRQEACRSAVSIKRNSHHMNRLRNPKKALLLLPAETNPFKSRVRFLSILRHCRIRLNQKRPLVPGNRMQRSPKRFHDIHFIIRQHRTSGNVQKTQPYSRYSSSQDQGRCTNPSIILQAEKQRVPAGVPFHPRPGAGLH
jgi:hypothetical protein